MKLKTFTSGCHKGTIRFFFGRCCYHKEKKARQNLQDSYLRQLDIERMIRSQLNLADFLRSHLTQTQKTLLAH